MSEGKQANNAWQVLFLLFLANLFNYFDRTIPVILAEPIRREWGLNDTQLGLVTSAFTVVYALSGVPLGRLADTGSRKLIMGVGLLVWSLLTGATGLAWGFVSFLILRCLVGVGEASYAPASTAMIGDLFPAKKRGMATGIFMLGLPIGLLLAFFTTGAIAQHFGSWRAPFFIAAVPGVLLAVFLFFIREPERGAAEATKVTEHKIDNPIGRVLKTPTLWCLVLCGLSAMIASYGTNGFLVPLVQRYFNLPLQTAAMATGIIVGASGLVGLTVGAKIADMVTKLGPNARLIYGAVSMFGSAVLIYFAIKAETGQFTMFVTLFTLGWLLQYNSYACSYPVLQDVIEPRLRATAMAIFFALLYILGGFAGPLLVGALSDAAGHAAMVAAGATEMTDQLRGLGLRKAMEVVPVAMVVSGLGYLLALKTFSKDAAAMRRSMAADPA